MKQEGELIEQFTKFGGDECVYVSLVEEFIEKKLKILENLRKKAQRYSMKLKEETELTMNKEGSE